MPGPPPSPLNQLGRVPRCPGHMDERQEQQRGRVAKCQPSGPRKLQDCSLTSPPAHRRPPQSPGWEGGRWLRGWGGGRVGAAPQFHMPAGLGSRHLAVVPILAGATDEALVAPLAPGALGLGEGLLEGMLLGVHLVIEEAGRQLRPVANLNLCRAKQWSVTPRVEGPNTHHPWSPLLGHTPDLSHSSPGVSSQIPT